jgi:hypothetical protein
MRQLYLPGQEETLREWVTLSAKKLGRRRFSSKLDGFLAATYGRYGIARNRNPANRVDNIVNEQSTCQHDHDEGELRPRLTAGCLSLYATRVEKDGSCGSACISTNRPLLKTVHEAGRETRGWE